MICKVVDNTVKSQERKPKDKKWPGSSSHAWYNTRVMKGFHSCPCPQPCNMHPRLLSLPVQKNLNICFFWSLSNAITNKSTIKVIRSLRCIDRPKQTYKTYENAFQLMLKCTENPSLFTWRQSFTCHKPLPNFFSHQNGDRWWGVLNAFLKCQHCACAQIDI